MRKWATCWGGVAAGGHRAGDVGKAAGGVGGDVEHRAAGAEFFGVGEQPAQLLQVLRRADVFEADGVRLARGAGEVGVDLGERAVAHYQQGRVVEGQRVGHELAQRAGQVTAGAFVLPAEVPAHPHVGPAMPGPGARGATLEAVVVGVGGGGHAEHRAQVEKESLGAGAFGERVVLPLGDELGGGHGCGEAGRRNEAGIVAEFTPVAAIIACPIRARKQSSCRGYSFSSKCAQAEVMRSEERRIAACSSLVSVACRDVRPTHNVHPRPDDLWRGGGPNIE